MSERGALIQPLRGVPAQPLKGVPIQQVMGCSQRFQFNENPLDHYKHAISKAWRLRDLKGERDWPEFLSTMGIKLQGFPFPENEPKGFLGHVNERPVIVFNNSLCLSRQEMTWAHELAHLVLEHQPPQNQTEWRQLEVEAELFAFWMVYPMDHDDLKERWKENPELQQIANLQLAAVILGVGLYAAIKGFSWLANKWE